MLGFPCVIFWAILGGHCYTQSVNDWDIYYFLFFACAFGMPIFCALAMYALREKRDTIADEELEKGEDSYIDETPGVSKRTLGLRDRAAERRNRP